MTNPTKCYAMKCKKYFDRTSKNNYLILLAIHSLLDGIYSGLHAVIMENQSLYQTHNLYYCYHWDLIQKGPKISKTNKRLAHRCGEKICKGRMFNLIEVMKGYVSWRFSKDSYHNSFIEELDNPLIKQVNEIASGEIIYENLCIKSMECVLKNFQRCKECNDWIEGDFA